MPDAQKVKAVLSEKGMTQKDLARKVGMERCNINAIINNDVDVRESTLKKMCEAMDVKAEDIW